MANHDKRYDCLWCHGLRRCSDGNDRKYFDWRKYHCHVTGSDDKCSDNLDHTLTTSRVQSLTSKTYSDKSRFSATQKQHPALQTFRTIVITLIITVLILSLVGFTGLYIYAYRHPTSPPGLWLIEHRPSTYISRFRNFTGINTESA